MTAFTSTAYSRDLGDELRRLRETCTGLNGRNLAIKLGWDPSKVSNIEHGRARASEIDLAQLFTACGKDIDFLEDFKRRYRHAFDQYFAQVPDNLRTLAMAEATATKITAYDIMTVHGLLQTERYAHELMVQSEVEAPEDVDRFVALRIDRQAVMRRPSPPECSFYIHEFALRMRLGDAQLMEDQYLRLLFNTHILRIVPVTAMTAALYTKRTLFEFKNASPVAYTESDLAKVFAQDSAAVTRSRALFERLDEIALDAEQSRSKLAEYVSGLRGDLHGSGTDLA
ncbi:helix-turn-helix domain-containing protein [Lentzea nigeriaca]|uniref:helix-turn-helix domain-containing protein n=1 Tax=Lentzea nigeriaca TaxID=1128665 RepID=UPI00195B6639|nr:helix-turn-helix transcriptional regulator [Lentzea nigeriaca]MBM7863365.1 transcriptional regulator with XRE-family HTH domain [Lentzea nigeriaca]